MSNAARSDSIAVYVHIPYCLSKCPYCDFNSYGISPQAHGRTALMQERSYLNALLAELRCRAGEGEWRARRCGSVFFGGGTPSLFSAESIAELIAAIREAFELAGDCEITLEANPGTIGEALGRGKLEALRRAGASRISVGAQSFRAEKLKTLGRWHSPADTRASVENIRCAGFENFNLDLMFGVPGETAGDWRTDLSEAVSLHPAHISAYGLTIEPGTEFAARRRRGLLAAPDEDLQAAMYCAAQDELAAAGFAQYEISNYARSGFECRHNLAYWQWGEYLGLGAGAHSFCKAGAGGGRRWSNIPKPEHYISRAAAGGDCSQRREEIGLRQAEQEFLLCGLRTGCGISLADYRLLFAGDFKERYSRTIDQLAAEALLAEAPDRIFLTRKGFLFADSVLKEFVT